MEETKKCKHCQSEIDKKAKICPHCRKKQGGIPKIAIFLVIGFFIALSIALGVNNENSSKPSNASNQGDSSNVKDDSSNSNKKKEEAIEFGSVGTSGDLAMRVNEAIDVSEIKENQFIKYTPDSGKFAVINVTIKNVGKKAISLTNGYFKLITEDGIEYSPSILVGLSNKYISFESINPGLELTGNLVFEIPKELELTNNKLEFFGLGLFDNSIKFNLK